MSDRLLVEYRPFALAIAKDFFLPGADRDDVEAEAMFGLWKAIRDYRPDGGASFKTFAALCIRRQIVTAVKAARRSKHEPLTYAARHAENADGETIDLLDLVADEASDPARIVEAREEAFALLRAIAERLTETERRALLHIAAGEPYAGIKWIDNACQRAKRKLGPPTLRQLGEAA